MPTYSYYCARCDQDKDRLVPMAEMDAQTCENCKKPLKRKIDAPGAVWNPTRTGGGMRT